MLRGLGEMVKGRWREFLREPSACFFVVFMPLLWMVILGVAIGGKGVETYGVGWLSAPGADAGADARAVHAALARDPRVRLADGDEAAMNTALERGDVLMLVQPSSAGPWTYTFDPANRDAARARLVLDDLVQTAAGRQDRLAVIDRPVAVPGTRYIDFLVPGLLALSIMTTSLFGTGAVIVASRRENLLKRYLATPMQPLAYICSHIIGRMFILVVEVVTVVAGGAVLFHVHIAGSFAAFALVSALGAAAFTALTLLCGSRTSNMAVMNGLSNLVVLPMMIVSGVWFSRADFPSWLKEPAKLLPLTALVDALRRITLEGGGLASVTRELCVLAAYLVLGALGARVLFKWY